MESNTVTDQTTKSIDVVARAVEALQSWDMDTYASLLADDIVWEGVGMDYMPGGGRYEGKEVMLNELGPVVASIYDTSSFTFDVKSVTGAEDTVIHEWLVTARTAYGRPYESRYCVVFGVTDGLVSSIREYTDTRYAQRLLFP
jgi:ketosteroid isomerase-like protein